MRSRTPRARNEQQAARDDDGRGGIGETVLVVGLMALFVVALAVLLYVVFAR